MILPVQALSALIYGSFPVTQIAAEFGIRAEHPDALKLLGRWFPPRPVFNDYWF